MARLPKVTGPYNLPEDADSDAFPALGTMPVSEEPGFEDGGRAGG